MPLAHDISGSGPAVILLHSTVADRRMWDPQMPALTAAGHRVIRCDLRGYGESPITAGEDWDDADDVTALLDTLGITRTAVIASSGGGRVALDLAARSPERVTALALLCTALRGHEPSPALRDFSDREDALLEAGDVTAATELNVDLWLGPEAGEKELARVRRMQRNAFEVQLAADRAAAALAADAATGPTAEPQAAPAAQRTQQTPAAAAEQAGSPAAAEQAVVKQAGSPAAEQAAAEQAAAPAARAEADLSVITAPALLVSGAHDLPDFREIAAHLATVLPKARHVELPWAGHLPSMERPDLLNPLLIDFLAESR
ncbi:alpha/beta hydrolase [Actinoplanes sp. NPDC023714]|uniref:alpha/beta fold hydrolase n=1 Tax=Actinoplanes sp. NPDC023714 TaxID=3154322 RepID=UPI0033EF5982